MKICVITPLYALAGVPLAQLKLATALSKQGHKVDLIFGKIESKNKFTDYNSINIINFNCYNVRNMFFPLLKYLKKTKPDVIFTAEDHLNTIVLLSVILIGGKSKVSASSRVTPFDTYSKIPFSKKWFLKICMKSVMWRADALTCVSKDMIQQYRKIFNSPRHVNVYNIVNDEISRTKMHENVNHDWLINKNTPVLIAAGMLAPWKGFTDLIYAIKYLIKTINVRLIILGDGPLRHELETLIKDNNLENNICLLGYVANPLKYFSKSDIFVLSSHVEGLPNVLVEAMMCGCTPVSTNCPTGPREVLQDGKYGYLVPVQDPIELSKGIEKALKKPISSNLLNEAIQPFEETNVINNHFRILGLAN